MAFGAIRKPPAPKAACQRQQGSPTNTEQRNDCLQQVHALPSRARHPILLAAQSAARPSGIGPAERHPKTAAPQQKRSLSQTHCMRGGGGRATVAVATHGLGRAVEANQTEQPAAILDSPPSPRF
ncbi:hypothetical protein NDU88_005492 [Pleurodeles waltl]|uniref:Uncharacterized protein n=1 Tax=Pleurodeles waltl TaxID=8319 RepID=A0AAV7RMD1_PLEWA|nr:hypothetical protein NDU88_005492 [Pleurodeles waltl]